MRKGGFDGLPPTYIPLRNGIFYSLAASYAEEVGADLIVGGHNKDDLAVFADTREAFFDAMQDVMLASSDVLRRRRTRISRPLLSKTKPQVVRLASKLGVPLALTWSCHRDGPSHCWRCEGCRGRLTAFEQAGVEDPLRHQGKSLKQ